MYSKMQHSKQIVGKALSGRFTAQYKKGVTRKVVENCGARGNVVVLRTKACH